MRLWALSQRWGVRSRGSRWETARAWAAWSTHARSATSASSTRRSSTVLVGAVLLLYWCCTSDTMVHSSACADVPCGSCRDSWHRAHTAPASCWMYYRTSCCTAHCTVHCTAAGPGGFVGTYGAPDKDGSITRGGYSTFVVADDKFVLRVPGGWVVGYCGVGV